MKKIVVLSGPIAVGKTVFSDELMRRYPCEKVSTRKYILRVKEVPGDRKALQDAGAELDRETGGAWVSDAATDTILPPNKKYLLIDSARTLGQVEFLRERFGRENVHHIHLTAPRDVLVERFEKRPTHLREAPTYDKATADQTESEVNRLSDIADVVVATEKFDVKSCVTFSTAGILSVDGPAVSWTCLWAASGVAREKAIFAHCWPKSMTCWSG